MSNFFTTRDGEIIEISTGIVQGFENTDFPPLSKDSQTLMRHFDGVSTERLGSIPKISVLGQDELRLLRKLRPWETLKAEFREDYRNLIKKINHANISRYATVRMKNYWGDPLSVYNSIQRSIRLSDSMKISRAQPGVKEFYSALITARWADPDDKLHSLERSIKLSDNAKQHWSDPNSKINSSETRKKMSDSAKNRWYRLTKSEQEKLNQKNSAGVKRFHAWKRSGAALCMLFESP